ncbi:MAG: spore germination protein [Lachnospiraceae bacterium]|nr:spore germination protein [Lachnospiraceae bacterium]
MSYVFGNSYEENKKFLDNLIRLDKSFDVIGKTLVIGGRKACYYLIDGFCKDEVMEKVLEFLYKLKPEEMSMSPEEFIDEHIPYGETTLIKDDEQFIQNFLSGVPILLIDGYNKMIATDFRTYPARSVDEPEKDKVMRGSRDGFVETVVFNTALIRRRIRDPRLVMEIHNIGRSSKTDVVVSYIEGRVNPRILEEVNKRIAAIDVDALTMNLESFVECFYPHRWYNPFPKFKFSERPDTAAASVLEGNIVILVDNSPSAIIVPTSVFDIVEDADDYYFPPITGTYLRLSRLIIDIAALLLSPTFLLLMMNPEWIPEGLKFIMIKETINVPILYQLLILEFAIDGMRLASLNTPNMLSTPLSIVAGIVLGDFTVSSGWFNSEIMLYMAFVAVANYTQSNFELGYALKFMRVITLIATGIFGIYGYVAGVVLSVLALACNKSFKGYSYLYPLIPFNAKQLLRRFFRISLPGTEKG